MPNVVPGQPERAERACATPAAAPTLCPAGAWVPVATTPRGDCNDSASAINPVAIEACDHIDNNCNGLIDELNGVAGGLEVTYTLDCDGDGYAPSPPSTTKQCPGDAFPQPACLVGPAYDYAPAWRRASELKGYDCADADMNAFDKSTHRSQDPVKGKSNYDYNCDGANTPWLSICDRSGFVPQPSCAFQDAASCWQEAQSVPGPVLGTTFIIGGYIPPCGQEAPLRWCSARTNLASERVISSGTISAAKPQCQ